MTIEYTEVDSRLRNVLSHVGGTGMLVHEHRLNYVLTKLSARTGLLRQACLNFGIENPNSIKQVKQYLSDKGVEVNSVAKQVLESLIPEHPDLAYVLAYRKASKLQSMLLSFGDAIDFDGQIRYKFKIDHESTGRIYVTDFNLQQLPALGRDCIIPDRKGFAVLDFKQFDLRVLAADSKDQDLQEIFQEGRDPYVETAKRIFHTEDVSSEQRGIAKIVNLAICYGAEPRGLSFNLGVTADVAKGLMTDFHEAYPQLTSWIEGVKQSAEEYGFAENRFGRRMPLDFSDRNKALRQAVAMRGQGGAGGILRRILLELTDNEINWTMTVHDSIVVDYDDMGEVDRALEIMLSADNGDVPLDATVKTGSTWGQAGHNDELQQDLYGIGWAP